MVEEKQSKKLGFWKKIKIAIKDFFGISTDKDKFNLITYLVLSIESIEEIVKMQGRANDKFESLFVICGLVFMDWLISENLDEKIRSLINTIETLIANVKIMVTELKIKAYEVGYRKNQAIQKILIAIQNTIEEFLQKNRNRIKIMLENN